MSASYFEFKRFIIHQDQCAMKVGTDGVLAGAWAELPTHGHVLDIGTGTGLMALMAAQRCEAYVTGIDIDLPATRQARLNAAASPWANRIEILQTDVQSFSLHTPLRFDAILSNPPYFTEQVKSPDARRRAARHTDELSFGELLRAVARLLTPDGTFTVIIPASAAPDFIALALAERLYLKRRTWVCTKATLPPRRVLMTFSLAAHVEADTDTLVLEETPGVRSRAYTALTSDFYLSR